jgi:hypothetical protein
MQLPSREPKEARTMAMGRIAAAGLVALMLGGEAAAAGLAATYVFSWAGLEVGELKTEVVQAGGSYRVAWRGQTLGLVGTLFPFASEGASEGRYQGGRFASERFAALSRRRDGDRAWGVTFAADGRVERIELPEGERAEREPVPADLQVGPDPAALALAAIHAAAPGTRLEGASFDGKRAVRFALACGETAMPTAAGQGQEQELLCTVAGRLLAGASRRWRAERSRDDAAGEREPVRVWLRPGPSPHGWWPVRIEVQSRFGTVTARLVRTEPRPHMGG